MGGQTNCPSPPDTNDVIQPYGLQFLQDERVRTALDPSLIFVGEARNILEAAYQQDRVKDLSDADELAGEHVGGFNLAAV